jgi:hypothetical protein
MLGGVGRQCACEGDGTGQIDRELNVAPRDECRSSSRAGGDSPKHHYTFETHTGETRRLSSTSAAAPGFLSFELFLQLFGSVLLLVSKKLATVVKRFLYLIPPGPTSALP